MDAKWRCRPCLLFECSSSVLLMLNHQVPVRWPWNFDVNPLTKIELEKRVCFSSMATLRCSISISAGVVRWCQSLHGFQLIVFLSMWCMHVISGKSLHIFVCLSQLGTLKMQGKHIEYYACKYPSSSGCMFWIALIPNATWRQSFRTDHRWLSLWLMLVF